MKAEISIGQLVVCNASIKEDTDDKFIYGSLFDFYADTKEDIERLTDNMYKRDLFGFSNIGRYVGIDEKTNKHYTFEDGAPFVDWLLRVASVIQEMNDNGDNITITISKKYLMDNKEVLDMTLENMSEIKNVEGLIDLYVYHLKNILAQADYGSLLKTQVKGKLSENISSKIKDNLIVINDRTCVK